MVVINEKQGGENETMTNADKLIELLQNPDENVEEFNNLIPIAINCPEYIDNNYDGFCNMSSYSGGCLKCIKYWLYKKIN